MKKVNTTASAANQKPEVLDSVNRSTDIIVASVKASSIQESETPLTSPEKELLAKCEATICKGLDAVKEVGDALLHIRDRRLYRAEFATLAQYCLKKWGLTARYAYYIMSAAEVVKNLEHEQLFTNERIAIPATESAARQLTKLDPKQQAQAAKLVGQKAGEPTARDYTVAAAQVTGKAPQLNKPSNAHLDSDEEKPRTRSYLPIPDETKEQTEKTGKDNGKRDLEKLLELVDAAQTQARQIINCKEVVKTLGEVAKVVTGMLNGGHK